MRSSMSSPTSDNARCAWMPARCSTKEAQTGPFCSASRILPSGASWSAKRKNCCDRRGVLLEELQHRVANSLQIIASILLMKARAVKSKETRLHLEDAHQRVMSVAAVQKQLYAAEATGSVEIG